MAAQSSTISIYDYTDYRLYLRDYYRQRKETQPAFSYRFFARRAGISSVGLYKDVVEGRESLGRSLITRFSAAMGHRKKEAEYFEYMVYFCESRTVEERQLYFRRMMALRETRASLIDASRFEYYSKWYYAAVRSLLTYYSFDGDFSKLGSMLRPPIRAQEAKRAVVLLEKLGFIRLADGGVYELVDPAITTGTLSSHDSAVNIINVITHQRTLNRLGTEAYDRFKTPHLDMSTLTVSVSKQTYAAIKEEVAGLRKKIAAMAEADHDPDRVYQINYQVFPLSRVESDGEA